jgi:hypothetical protein
MEGKLFIIQALSVHAIEIPKFFLAGWEQQLRKATIILIMSVRHSVPLFTKNSATPTGRNVIKLHILDF